MGTRVHGLFTASPYLFLPREPWGMDTARGLRLGDFGKRIIQFSAAKVFPYPSSMELPFWRVRMEAGNEVWS